MHGCATADAEAEYAASREPTLLYARPATAPRPRTPLYAQTSAARLRYTVGAANAIAHWAGEGPEIAFF